MKQRLIRTALYCVIGLLIGAGIGFWQVSQDKNTPATAQNSAQSTPVAGVKIGGPYELINHMGETVTDQNFANRYKLIYFGFTYCPAICPTELAKITAVMDALPARFADQIQPLFITIDPERDTQEIMRDYVTLFHERLIGLTGSQDQIDAIKKTYRVFARKVQDPDMTDYTMDHSSYIYFMSPSDQLLGMYRIKDKVDFIAQDIEGFLL